MRKNRQNLLRRLKFVLIICMALFGIHLLFRYGGSYIQYSQTCIQCVAQLKGIGNEISSYQSRYNGKYPTDWETLIEETGMAKKTLHCPGAVDPNEFSYTYRGNDLRKNESVEMILAYDKSSEHHDGKRNVLFTDGNVDTFKEEDFQKLIERDNELRRQQGLQEKPVK